MSQIATPTQEVVILQVTVLCQYLLYRGQLCELKRSTDSTDWPWNEYVTVMDYWIYCEMGE